LTTYLSLCIVSLTLARQQMTLSVMGRRKKGDEKPLTREWDRRLKRLRLSRAEYERFSGIPHATFARISTDASSRASKETQKLIDFMAKCVCDECEQFSEKRWNEQRAASKTTKAKDPRRD
jgi:undecaprenyl pyrophosphate synthase